MTSMSFFFQVKLIPKEFFDDTPRADSYCDLVLAQIFFISVRVRDGHRYSIFLFSGHQATHTSNSASRSQKIPLSGPHRVIPMDRSEPQNLKYKLSMCMISRLLVQLQPLTQNCLSSSTHLFVLFHVIQILHYSKPMRKNILSK